MKNKCMEVYVYGERLYRLFLDIIKLELDSMGVTDINSIQALTLMNIGDSIVTVGELRSKGYYSGSNASYNIKKMVSNGYILQNQAEYDKRASCLQLSKKGIDLCRSLEEGLKKYSTGFSKKFNDEESLDRGIEMIKKMEGAWRELVSNSI